MIIVDFGIICIGQKECTYPESIKDIRFEAHRREPDSKAMYCDDWYNFHTADKLTGYWYFVWLPEEIIYDDSFFDLDIDSEKWVRLVPEWADTARKILEFYLEESPEHRIAILIREQDKSHDIVHPACSLEEWMNMALQGKIKWNELYFIEKRH